MSKAGAMTGESAPTIVPVDLGPRSYDILIGRNLIDTAGDEIAQDMATPVAAPDKADFHVTDSAQRPSSAIRAS